MTNKHWTPRDMNYLIKNVLLDSTNQVVNVKQLAKRLKRSESAVNKRIGMLRKEGELPPIEMEKSIDLAKRPYSDRTIKQIEFMIQKGNTTKEIAESLGKTESAISSLIFRLRKKGTFTAKSGKSEWSTEEEKYLINHIQFDENGYTSNVNQLANHLSRSVSSVSAKISKLRKNGTITICANASKTSVKAKQAHDQFNQKRFMNYQKEVSTVINTPNKVEVVQVVHTVTVGPNGNEIHQFWSFDGKMLAENKNPSTVGAAKGQ